MISVRRKTGVEVKAEGERTEELQNEKEKLWKKQKKQKKKEKEQED